MSENNIPNHTTTTILTSKERKPLVSIGATETSYSWNHNFDPHVHFEYGIPVWRLDFEHDPKKQELFFDVSPWLYENTEVSEQAREAFSAVLGEYYVEALEEAYGCDIGVEHMKPLIACDGELGYTKPFEFNIVIRLSFPLDYAGELHKELDHEKILHFFAPLMKVADRLDVSSTEFDEFMRKVESRIPRDVLMEDSEVVNLFYSQILE